jgi:hypothetical protein
VVRGTETEFGSGETEKLPPEGTREHVISIRDNRFRHTVQFEDIIEEKAGNTGSRIRMGDGNKMGIAGKFIHNYQNSVETSRLGETFYEIHRNHFPGVIGYWQRLKESGVSHAFRLRLLAHKAGLHLFTDRLFHERPGKQLFDTAVSHREAGMAAGSTGVQGIGDARLQRKIGAQPDAPMFADNSIAEKESVESLSLEHKASQDSSGFWRLIDTHPPRQ